MFWWTRQTATWHNQCLSLLSRQRERPNAWFSTWPIVYEFLRVTTHARALQKPFTTTRAWEFIASTLLAAPGFSMLAGTSRHADVAREVLAEAPRLAGNILHGAHTAILMREHGIRRICTRDADFLRFPFLEVIDPLAV
jgi:hypothetical protein